MSVLILASGKLISLTVLYTGSNIPLCGLENMNRVVIDETAEGTTDQQLSNDCLKL